MHNLRPFCLVLFTIAVFTACKKDKDDGPSIIGLWKGKYGGTANYPNLGYTVLFRNNGTVRVYDGNDTATATKAEGTYTVTNAIVNTSYSYSAGLGYSTTAEINLNKTFQEGTYGSGTNTSGSGRFFLVKQ